MEENFAQRSLMFFAINMVLKENYVPGTPQQNNVVERMNHTLLERARCMMSTVKLGKEF